MLSRIKICGITDKESLDACITVGVGFIGFNFVKQSPRYIKLDDAFILADHVPITLMKVALVVDESDDVISNIIQKIKPNYLQLHGYETLQRVITIKEKFKIPIIKAVGVAEQSDIDNSKIYFDIADMMLFDAKPKAISSLTGGLGKTFDWSLVSDINGLNKPFMLAGGLNYSNLTIAKQQSKATYFDICSGVEKEKGKKSIELIYELEKLSTHFS